MRDCRVLHSRANRSELLRAGRYGLQRACALAAFVSLLTISSFAKAQSGGDAPLVQVDGADSGAPMSNMGGGDFFSQELGTILRLRYNTENYGQDEHGNFDIGTMQVTNFDDAIAFFDGQVTLNEQQGVGFNLGLGYRVLADTPFAMEPQRINGLSLWADGTDTKGGEFFPQVGVSFESLGDMWDMRVNGYIPLGARTKTASAVPTGVIGFAGNELVDATVADQHTSFDVAELEIARRIGNDRDAWVFAGPYVLANNDDDSAGWKVGVRGYAYPDLLLQFAVSQDDIFQTNAAFSLTWFVGRTRTNFQPACGLPDRMREPVMRNDYVALSKTIIHGGTPLTDAVSGEPFNVVHVNSAAAPGGNGTFEHPLNDVANVEANSQPGKLVNLVNGVNTPTPGSIVLLWANSNFNGQGTLVLKDNQRLLGEGNNMKFFVDSTQHGPNTLIPETSPGARAGNVPIIMNALGDAVSLADTNEVANFTINGGARGIVPSSNIAEPGAGNPNIHDLTVENTTGDGIVLTPLIRDNDGNPGTPQKTMAFNVTLNNLTFDNVGGNDISIDATPPGGVVLPDPNVTLQEAMTISNINSTNGNGRGIFISNTHTGGTETISSYNHDGGTTSTEALVFANAAGTATVNTSTFTGGTAIDGGGVFIDTSTGNFTFANTVTFTNLTGGAVKLNGNTAGTVMFQGDITNTPAANVDSILLTNNTGQDINFNGNLKLTATGTGKAFSATGGGTLTTTGTDNELSSENDTALEVSGMTISNAGVTIHKLSAGTASVGPTSGIILTNNTGGAITVGDTTALAGDTGTIQNATGDAIFISNSANATVTGITLSSLGASATGVHVNKDSATATSTVNLNNLDITGGQNGVQVTGGGTGAGNLTMTINDININHPTDTGLGFDNVDNVSQAIAVNNVKIDGLVHGTPDVPTTTTGISVHNSNAGITFDSNTSVAGIKAGGDSFLVDGGTTGTITYNGKITNADATAVRVRARTGGAVTFTPTSTITATGPGPGILVGGPLAADGNTGGTITFQGTNSLHTTAGDAVTVTNNTGANVTFSGLDIQTTSGQGFNASGGGTLEVDGTTNKIKTTAGGTGLRIDGMTIAPAGVSFQSVDVAAGATNGIVLNNNTGGPITVGNSGATAGQSGTITGTTGAGVSITNTANATLNGVTVTNAGGDALAINHNNASNMSVTANNTTINTTHTGVHINGTGGTGTFNVTTAGGTTTAAENGLEIQGAVTNVTDADNITNTTATGHSINVHNLSAGNVTHTGTVNDTGGGLAINNNTGGSTNLIGTYTLNTGANDAVTLTGNATAANISLSGLNIDTTTGRGFHANGGGTLAVNGTTNTIDTTGGAGSLVGLDIENTTIAGAGVNFQHVNVAGSANGVILNNLTGGTVTVGTGGGAVGAGGTLNTTGDAVLITNAANVTLHDLHVTGAVNAVNIQQTAAAAADIITIDGLNVDATISGIGVNVLAQSTSNFTVRLENSTINKNVLMNDTGSGTFGLLVDNTDVNSTGTTNAFDVELNTAAHLGNLVFRNGNTFTAGDANALVINSAGATAKTVNLLIDGTGVANTFTNASATKFAADLLSQGNTSFNATVQGNTFENGTTPADDFDMKIGTSTARVLLSLGGAAANEKNTASGAGGTFVLDNNAAGTFNVFDKADVITVPTFNNGTILPLPNAAAIGNSLTPPTPPTAP